MWIRDAWKIIAANPLGMFGIVGFYLTIIFVVTLPGDLLGLDDVSIILSAMVTPFGALAFTAAGRDVTRGAKPGIVQAFMEGWKDPFVRSKLGVLGVIYGVLILLNGYLIRVLSAETVKNWQVVDGILDVRSVSANIPWTAVIVGGILYILILFVTCFSPMLVAWRKQSIGKAFFYSLFVCLRNLVPFFGLGSGLFLIALAGTVTISLLTAVLGSLSTLIIVLWGIFLTAWSYSALWPMWVTFFGEENTHV